MKRTLLLAIDIGTSNSKGAVFTTKGELVASESIRHSVSHPHPGWAEHDGEKIWWTEFVTICHRLLENYHILAEEIVSVAISSLTPAVLPVDEAGNPLRPAMLYGLDTRAAQEIDEMNKILGEQYSLEQNGRPMDPKSTGPKMLWIKKHEPEVFAKTRYFLGCQAFLVYRLTGRAIADVGCFKLAGLPFSNRKLYWDKKACEACGITMDMLPELTFGTEKAGEVTKDAAEITGLAPGTTVAVGTGDFLAETLSYGTLFYGKPQICYGTCIGVDNGNDHASILFPDFSFAKLSSIPGGSMSNGCANIDWMMNILSGVNCTEKFSNEVWQQLYESSAPGANGILILPYFNGAKTPYRNPNASGTIFGLHMYHTQADLYRAALESMAFAIKDILEMNPDYRGEGEAVVMGGGTNIPGLLQVVSDVTGLKQTLFTSHNGALVGDAFIAGLAVGIFQDREEYNSWVELGGTVQPDPETKELYAEKYKKYQELKNALKPLYEE